MNEIDPKLYKWRVSAGIITILLTLSAVTLIGTISTSQSKESIVFLVGLAMGVVIIVVLTLFRTTLEKENKKSLKDNPAFVIAVAIIAELIASFVSAYSLRMFQ